MYLYQVSCFYHNVHDFFTNSPDYFGSVTAYLYESNTSTVKFLEDFSVYENIFLHPQHGTCFAENMFELVKIKLAQSNTNLY